MNKNIKMTLRRDAAFTAILIFGLACALTSTDEASAQSRVSPIEGISSETAAKEVGEGSSVFYKISDTDPTRLVVEGTKIRLMNYLGQEIDIKKDAVTGQAYLTPKVNNKVISIFVTTVSGITFTLLVQPAPGPSTSIRVRERSTKTTMDSNAPAASGTPGVMSTYVPLGESLSQEQAITGLMLTAASRRPQQGVDAARVSEEIRLWQGVRFLREMTYRTNTLVLDQFDLRVTGTQPVRMVEQEFYREGVLAVAIEQQILNPGDSTKIYIVRGGAE